MPGKTEWSVLEVLVSGHPTGNPPCSSHVLIRSDPPENQWRVPELFRELTSGKVQHEYIEFAGQVIRKRSEQQRFRIRGPDGPNVHGPDELVNELGIGAIRMH